MCTNKIEHSFAGFGPAPYHIVRVTEKVFVIPGVCVRAGGTCDYCGTCIRWAYTVRAANGVEFDVGCDCAMKCGMTAAEIKEARRADRAERRARESAAARSARLDEQRAIVFAEHGVRLTFEELRLARSEGRAAAWAWLRAERVVNAQYIGTVGKRLRGLELLVERAYSFVTAYGTKTIWTCRDRANNCVVYKSCTPLGLDDGYRGYQPVRHTVPGTDRSFESRWFRLDATVKEHSEYKGLRQTVIQRCKVTEILSDWIST